MHDGSHDARDACLTYPLGDHAPAPGALVRVADGVRWWRTPVPGPLRHVNGYLLDDGPGAAMAVDTGIAGAPATDAWRTMLDGPLAGTRIARILVTHMHPDHIGLAGWLSRKSGGAPLLMTRTEWHTARVLVAEAQPDVPPEQLAFWTAAGWDAAQLAQAKAAGWASFARIVARLPAAYTRIEDGETLHIGGAGWRVVTGRGHSPEHACLLNAARGILIAGDQVLPRISPNVSLHAGEENADPLGDWFGSIARFRELPADLLVLPGHGEPFRGLHTRLDALAAEHRMRLDALAALIADRPRRAVDCFAALFRRPIGPDVLGMATGEALAHLRRLEREGRAIRREDDGIWWFEPA